MRWSVRIAVLLDKEATTTMTITAVVLSQRITLLFLIALHLSADIPMPSEQWGSNNSGLVSASCLRGALFCWPSAVNVLLPFHAPDLLGER